LRRGSVATPYIAVRSGQACASSPELTISPLILTLTTRELYERTFLLTSH
jgi:hypothetical protein